MRHSGHKALSHRGHRLRQRLVNRKTNGGIHRLEVVPNLEAIL